MKRIAVLAFVCPQLHAQIAEWQTDWSSQVHELWESIDFHQKINLHTATLTELELLGFSQEQGICLIQHQQIYGPIAHLSELQQCDISTEQIRLLQTKLEPISGNRLQAFLSSHDSQLWIPQIRILSNVLQSNQEQGGLGQVQQLQALWGNWSRLNMLVHSDPGERFHDHFSAALEVKGMGNLDQLIIGKYQWYWNQGLIMMAPYAVGRTYQMSSWVHQQQQLRSAVSSNEDMGLWGVAGTYNSAFGNWYVSVGGDYIDTRLQGVGFTKRNYGGIHLSELELERKHNNLLSQQFLAWNKHIGAVQVNASHVRYQYQIPKITPWGIYAHQHYSEIQISTEHVWNSRSIFNVATEGFQQWSYYLASIWSLNPQLDIAIKSQRIPTHFLAPELSPFSLSDLGNTIHEIGIDQVLGNHHRIQWRSTMRFPLDSLNIDRLRSESASQLWQLQYAYTIDKTQFIAWRFQLPQSKSNDHWSTWVQTKINLQEPIQLQTYYSLRMAALDRSSMILALISWRIYRHGRLQLYAGSFHGNELHYLPLPSAQYPWRLGMFSGNGNTFGIIANFRINKHLKWRFSVEQIQKMDISGHMERQKPRIFVQLEIL